MNPIAFYLCTHTVDLKRGGDWIGIAFTAGHVYQQVGVEFGNAVLVNDAGGNHLMPPKMLGERFRKVSQDYVPGAGDE